MESPHHFITCLSFILFVISSPVSSEIRTTCNSIEETYAECVIEIKVLSKNDLMDLAKTENGLLNLCNMSSKAISCMESFARKCGYTDNGVYNSLTNSFHDLVNQFCLNLSVSDCHIDEHHSNCWNIFQKESVHLEGTYQKRKIMACRYLKRYQKCINEYFEARCGPGIVNYFNRKVFKPMSLLHIYADCLPQYRYECEDKHRNDVMYSCANIIQESKRKLSVCQKVTQYRRCAMIKFTRHCRPNTAMEYVDSKLPISEHAEFNRCIHNSASIVVAPAASFVIPIVAAMLLQGTEP